MNIKLYFRILPLLLVCFIFTSCGPKQEQPREQKTKAPLFKTEISRAAAKEEEGDLLLARKLYKEAFSKLSSSRDIGRIKKKIEGLNMRILFSPVLDEDSLLYRVKQGDTLDRIAKQFNTTVDLIKKVNRIKSDMIRVRDTFKITKAKFSLVIDKSQNLLFLKKNDEIYKTYVVSTGKENSTPVGDFKIITKLENPPWFRKEIKAVIPAGSPDNILGTRWLGFNRKGYGIHGTTKPGTLGTQTTEGCIRMRNEEVEEVFGIVPRGTEVTIIN